jgi:hypothetical protein
VSALAGFVSPRSFFSRGAFALALFVVAFSTLALAFLLRIGFHLQISGLTHFRVVRKKAAVLKCGGGFVSKVSRAQTFAGR